jgi:hypothetical protein
VVPLCFIRFWLGGTGGIGSPALLEPRIRASGVSFFFVIIKLDEHDLIAPPEKREDKSLVSRDEMLSDDQQLDDRTMPNNIA